MALSLDDWTGLDTTVGEIERRIRELRRAVEQDGVPDLRTSVLTHLAWVPPVYEQDATDTLAGLGERHPSRAILLIPDPDAGSDGLDAEIALRCFSLPGLEAHVCSEVIELQLRGRRSAVPASVVVPLLISDLPVFLRWRGRPAFGEEPFGQLVATVDRLVVDSEEWADPASAYVQLAGFFERVAVSDIAWARALEWRRALAGLWPGIAEAGQLHVTGPRADALLLAGWLRSRLDVDLGLVHTDAGVVEAVKVDGEEVARPRVASVTPSDLLSTELDRFSRDSIYEAAVEAVSSLGFERGRRSV